MAVEVEAVTRGGTGAGGVRSRCGRGALHLAAANGRTHVCRFLIQDLALPVDDVSTSGTYQPRLDRLLDLRSFLARLIARSRVRARVCAGETPLLLAATFGHTATAAYLLERGAGLSTPDPDGETPLHWAAYNGTHTHIVLTACESFLLFALRRARTASQLRLARARYCIPCI